MTMDPNVVRNFDLTEESKTPSTPATQKTSRRSGFVLKALSIVLIASLLPFVTTHCLPLLKPAGVMVVQRLWDVLKFLLITTIVSLGILNSRSKYLEKVPGIEGKNSSSNVSPIAGVFGEMGQFKLEYETSDSTQQQREVQASYQNSRHVNVDRIASGPKYQNDGPTSSTQGAMSKEFAAQEIGFQASKFVRSTATSERYVSGYGPVVDDVVSQQVQHISSREDGITGSTGATQIDRSITGSDGKRRLPRSSDEDRQGSTSGNGKQPSQLAQRRGFPVSVVGGGESRSHKRSTSLDTGYGYGFTGGALRSSMRTPSDSNLLAMDVSYRAEFEEGSGDEEDEMSKGMSFSSGGLSSAGVEEDGKGEEAGVFSPRVTSLSPGGGGGGDEVVVPSPNEVNRKADAFIAKFREQIRLQRLESIERQRHRSTRS